MDVQLVEEEYELQFPSTFDPANDIRRTIRYPRDERPLTSNLIREISAHKLPEVLGCGGLSVAVCYGLYKINPAIHAFEFREASPKVMLFKLRIPVKVATSFRRDAITGLISQKLEKELKLLPSVFGTKFLQYSDTRIINCNRRLSPNEIRQRQYEQNNNVIGPRYIPPEDICTGANGVGFLGQGCSGVVLLAYHHDIGNIAVKCMENHLPQDEDRCRLRFDGEAKMLFKLSHSNVVAFFGITGWQGAFGLLMEYLSGGNLSSLCQNGNSTGSLHFPWPLRLRIIKDIASGLAYLHSKKIVHGDMKPANVLLDQKLRAKIVDFGGAEIAATSGTTTSKVKRDSDEKHQYTLIYAAPEFLTNIFGRRKTPEDVYSLAIIIYEVIVQRKASEDFRVKDIGIFKEAVKAGQRPDLTDVENLLSTMHSSGDNNIITFLKEIMVSSWSSVPKRRPTMQEIEQQADKFGRNISETSLREMVDVFCAGRTNNPLPQVTEWLKLSCLEAPDFCAKRASSSADSDPAPATPNHPFKNEPSYEPAHSPAKSDRKTKNPNEKQERKHEFTFPKSDSTDLYTPTASTTFGTGFGIEDMLETFSLSEDAESLWLKKEYSRAIDLFNKIMTINTTSPSVVALTKLKIAHCHYCLGSSVNGNQEMCSGLNILQIRADSKFVPTMADGNSMVEVARTYYDTGQQSRALLIIKQAATIFGNISEARAKVSGLERCARLIKKHHSQRLTSSDRVVAVCKYIVDCLEPVVVVSPTTAGSALHSLAYFMDELTEYELAVKYYKAGMNAVEKCYGKETAQRTHFYTRTLHNLAVTYMNMGLYKKADEMFKFALELDHKVTDYDSAEQKTESILQTERLIQKNGRRLELL
nr:uncharacterized protein LOC100186208 isoform X1 [Ciona intestinalis]|eukprot:XP_002122776.1 uncharacterized protein LOC100186208 isoform X1 [Ciona intestinalis]